MQNLLRKTFVVVEVQTQFTPRCPCDSLFLSPSTKRNYGKHLSHAKLDLREGKNLPLFISVLPHKSQKHTTVCSKHSAR